MRIFLLFFAIFPRLSRCLFGEECPGKQYKNVKILWIEHASFHIKQESNGTLSGIFPQIMKKSLKSCCARLNYTFVKVDYGSKIQHEDDALEEMKKRNDTILILFPQLANIAETSTFSMLKFVPIKTSPGPMVLASKASIQNSMGGLFILQMWINPAFYLILAMATGAGAMFWILEFQGTAKHSFAGFIREIGSSIWFSIVTMTTVGYGDIVPRSALAKINTVLWMLMGIVLTSLFTARITSAMTTLYFDEIQTMLGKKVGVIQGTRIFFQSEINFGAVMTEYKEHDLFKALSQGNVSRIILPDFLDAMYLLTTAPHRNYFDSSLRIVESIRHPFLFGISVVAYEDLDNKFMGCLGMGLKWSYLRDSKIDYSAIDENFIKSHSIDDVSDELMLSIARWIIIASAIMLALVTARWLITPILQRRLTKTDSNNKTNGTNPTNPQV